MPQYVYFLKILRGLQGVALLSRWCSAGGIVAFAILMMAPIMPATAEDLAECDLIGPLEIRDRAVFNPGRYCGDIILQDADVEFSPGVYVIAGGDLKTRGVTKLAGEGVAFIFTGETPADIGRMDFAEGTETRLIPPESGDYQGALISRRGADQLAQGRQ